MQQERFDLDRAHIARMALGIEQDKLPRLNCSVAHAAADRPFIWSNLSSRKALAYGSPDYSCHLSGTVRHHLCKREEAS
ncbi:MAG: hypothetical protein WBB79_08085, partial [Candidatus Macondimonas sp.]